MEVKGRVPYGVYQQTVRSVESARAQMADLEELNRMLKADNQ